MSAKIVGIAGTLRKGSCNSALLRAAVELAPPGLMVETASIAGIPVIGATPGGGGTRLAQSAWLPVLRTLGTRPGPASSSTSRARLRSSTPRRLTDEEIRPRLSEVLPGFAGFVGEG